MHLLPRISKLPVIAEPPSIISPREAGMIDDSSGSQGQKRGRAHEHDECENVEEESPKVHKGSTSSGVLEQDLDLDLNESGDETNA